MTFVFKQHATGASVRRNDNESGNGSIPDNEVSYATSKRIQSGLNFLKLCRSPMKYAALPSAIRQRPTLTKWHSYVLKLKDLSNAMFFCYPINRPKSVSSQLMIDGDDSVVISPRQESGLCVNSFRQNVSSMI